MAHKFYNNGLILVYTSAGAPHSAKEIYKDQTIVSSFPQLVRDAEQKSRETKIGWLRIVAHGSPKSIAIGTSAVSEQTIENFKSDFTALSRLLTAQAVVELYSCLSGLDNALLLRISDLLGGRAVLAYKEKQSALNLDSFKWKGEAKVCMSQICHTLDKHGHPIP
jgi:hypothetical protein